MGGKDEPHFVVADLDIGMMACILCEFGDAVYEIDRLSEIVEFECALDCLPFGLPLREIFQCFFDFLGA